MEKTLLIENSGLVATVENIPAAVKESIDQTGLMILKGVPCSVLEEVNGNGRKYTRKEMNRAIRACREGKLFESRRLLCAADDHPKESFVPPANASHIVIDAYTREDNGRVILKNDWLVTETTKGKDLKALVQAGGSFGTSIRGLGQINDSTAEVEQYEFLGTDAVGNPSAGTFASIQNFKVTVESLNDPKEAERIREQLERQNMHKDTFDLNKAIGQFKEKFFVEGKAPDVPTHAMVAELLGLQLKAVDDGLDVAAIDTLTNEIYGESSQPPKDRQKKDNSDDQNRDVKNRAERELEATQNLAQHLKDEVKKLEETKASLEKEIKAYKAVSENLYVQIQEIERESDAARTDEAKRIARKALSAMSVIQKEAHDVITSLETRLENSLRIGDTAVENAIILRRICDELYRRILKITDSQENAFRTSHTKMASIEGNGLTQPPQNQSKLGNRAGWH